MGFTEAIGTCFRKYATFSGRASRSEFWWFVLFLLLGSVALAILDGLIFGGSASLEQVIRTDANGNETVSYGRITNYDGGWLETIFSIVTFLPWLAVTWRRLHDRDIRGWWAFLPHGLGIVTMLALVATTVGFDGFLSGGPEMASAMMRAFREDLPMAVSVTGAFASFAASIWLVVTLASRGTPGPNRFGPPPADAAAQPTIIRVGNMPHIGKRS
ncbi:DUF805 domain-containing protein [Jannaschia formosa]|uniref:DUF805 domain-containing protein n=1 Tax=Jannaschia formosa TaxID=2259592 RepID=UPI000E1BCA2C|nr:DUF805 domain-containing protein [Jannaschia formosa]TFL19213.1 DUF805 domain-containing protein [Jannaschia formosa]